MFSCNTSENSGESQCSWVLLMHVAIKSARYDCEKKGMRKLEDHMFKPVHSVIVSSRIRREHIYRWKSMFKTEGLKW